MRAIAARVTPTTTRAVSQVVTATSGTGQATCRASWLTVTTAHGPCQVWHAVCHWCCIYGYTTRGTRLAYLTNRNGCASQNRRRRTRGIQHTYGHHVNNANDVPRTWNGAYHTTRGRVKRRTSRAVPPASPGVRREHARPIEIYESPFHLSPSRANPNGARPPRDTRYVPLLFRRRVQCSPRTCGLGLWHAACRVSTPVSTWVELQWPRVSCLDPPASTPTAYYSETWLYPAPYIETRETSSGGCRIRDPPHGLPGYSPWSEVSRSAHRSASAAAASACS